LAIGHVVGNKFRAYFLITAIHTVSTAICGVYQFMVNNTLDLLSLNIVMTADCQVVELAVKFTRLKATAGVIRSNGRCGASSITDFL
jgi:hypothetical protein